MFLHGHYKQIAFDTFLTRLSIPFTCINMAVTFLVIFICYFSSSGLRLSLHQRLVLLVYHQKYYCDVNLLWDIAIIIKLKTCYNLKNEMTLDITLKFFGLQKTTTVDNYGGGTPTPLFPNRGHFMKNNLDWMKTTQKRKIYMVVLIS